MNDVDEISLTFVCYNRIYSDLIIKLYMLGQNGLIVFGYPLFAAMLLDVRNQHRAIVCNLIRVKLDNQI